MTYHRDVRAMVGRLFIELMSGPCTHAELVEASGLAGSTVREWMRDWRKAGIVRICDWEKIRGGQVVKPVYELNPGNLPDVKRPKAKTASDRTARYRFRKRLRDNGMHPAAIEQAVALHFPRWTTNAR